jgi:hypothetical protein
MLRKFAILSALWLVCTSLALAQSAEKPRVSDKSDIISFHRQILSLKEYNDERAKIPALQKANKVTVKVKAIVDTADLSQDGDDEGKPNTRLTGYIRQEIGSESVDLYQLTFDRVKKKITAVVPVADSSEMHHSAAPAKKAGTKKAAKKGDEDDDDDEDEKPASKKSADKADKDDDN